MIFRDSERLIANGATNSDRKIRADALEILGAAIDAVDPTRAVLSHIRRNGDIIEAGGKMYDLRQIGKVVVVGGGKAGAAMAEALESLLGDRITRGVVNVLRGTEKGRRVGKVRLVGASHPIPDEAGAEGVAEMLRLVSGLSADDLVVVLISGGGSALMPQPAQGVSLEDIQVVTSFLLRAGATINELNAVRKHLDSFKGGQLAKRCSPAEVLVLIMSDVVGDPLDTIASGPTAPDDTTWRDATEVLRRYGLQEKSPSSVKKRLEKGIAGYLPDTPKTQDPAFARVNNVIVANNSSAVEAAMDRACTLGYDSMILSTMVEGAARHVGSVYAGILREESTRDRPVRRPMAIIVGGETTVKVEGQGRGGRNQEVVLGAVGRLPPRGCLIASLATDGIDGPTDAAGAVADGLTRPRALTLGLSVDDYLARNDSYAFFDRLGDLLVTGPTGTNVNDIALMLAAEG